MAADGIARDVPDRATTDLDAILGYGDGAADARNDVVGDFRGQAGALGDNAALLVVGNEVVVEGYGAAGAVGVVHVDAEAMLRPLNDVIADPGNGEAFGVAAGVVERQSHHAIIGIALPRAVDGEVFDRGIGVVDRDHRTIRVATAIECFRQDVRRDHVGGGGAGACNGNVLGNIKLLDVRARPGLDRARAQR